jgi:hypothetical protein
LIRRLSFFKKIHFFGPGLIIALTFISATWVNFNVVFWQGNSVIKHDVAFYYSYLPATFYEQDLSLAFLNDTANVKLEGKYYAPPKAPNGNYVIKSTYGMSLTYLPFFAGAHLYAKLLHEETNGFSSPYHFAVQFSSLFYFLIGLIFLLKILRMYFEESVAALCLFVITFGTNAFYYITIGGGMSHAADFGLAAVFIYYSILWHRRPSAKISAMVGVAGGLLTLIRPINLLVFIFFFLYQVKSTGDLRVKIKLLLQNKFKLAFMALIGFLLFLPQMLYWKHQTGSWLFNSYVGEHFLFHRPQIFNGLFSFRKGWLVYTPVMALSLTGLYHLYKNKKDFFYAVTGLFTLYIYVAFSWWCWWYGGSFGQRSLIDLYPFLSISLAAFLAGATAWRPLLKKALYLLIALTVLLNLFQTMQAKYNIIHYDSMTREAYFDAFFRTSKDPGREKFLKHPDDEKAKAGVKEY